MKQEELALTVVCPVCRVGVNRPCQKLTKAGRPAGIFARISSRILKHPHKVRIDKAKATQ